MTDERDIEQRLVSAIRRAGGLCLKWVCPGWAGVPDRIILMPGGRVSFVELKRPRGGRIADRQAWWSRKLWSLGFVHYYIQSDKDVYDFLELLMVEQG